MISDIVHIDSHGTGFETAEKETGKVAVYTDLGARETTCLRLITEEMLSMVRMIMGASDISFWIEHENGQYQFHLSTETLMDSEKRYLLISSASSRKNDAARSLLGKLRDKFEEAMLVNPFPSHPDNNIPPDLLQDIFYHPSEDPEWDRYERSVLRKITDDIRIGIRGGRVDMTVCKRFV